jgi:D-alanine transaminase
MSRVAWVNGRYAPIGEPRIGVEDRGYQFADAVYEVWGVRAGALMDEAGHYARLRRSLGELSISLRMTDAALRVVLVEVARRNRVRDGLVYLQISRGEAPRDHAFPVPAVAPVAVVTAKRVSRAAQEARAGLGVAVTTTPDIRWGRCDIKTVGLLPNVLAKQAAREAGAFEAWFVDDAGFVTEGTASNAWIVDGGGVLRTQPLSRRILHGVTRATLMRLAQERQMRVEEAPFTVAEAKAAREAFISSATNPAQPVVRIDGATIGDGKPGPVAQALRAAYFGAATGWPGSRFRALPLRGPER